MAIVKCHVRTVQKTKMFTGAPLDVYVKMYLKCAYSELCVSFGIINIIHAIIPFCGYFKRPHLETSISKFFVGEKTISPSFNYSILENRQYTLNCPVKMICKMKTNCWSFHPKVRYTQRKNWKFLWTLKCTERDTKRLS